MAQNTTDLEKGPISSTVRSATSSWNPSAPVRAENNSQVHSPLELFQLLVGIHTPPSLTYKGSDFSTDGAGAPGGSKSHSHARGDNIGIYQRAKLEERKARIQYALTSYISNTLFLFQIMLAATFTGLSAYKETTAVTLTVLGAINTVLAGCLAWQKGMGVPQRYRKAQDEYQALLFEIEMTERSFLDVENNNGGGGAKLDPRVEKARLQKLYDIARADQQANYPDLYVSTGAAAAKETKDLEHQIESMKAEAAKVQEEMAARVEALMKQLEGNVVARAEDALSMKGLEK